MALCASNAPLVGRSGSCRSVRGRTQLVTSSSTVRSFRGRNIPRYVHHGAAVAESETSSDPKGKQTAELIAVLKQAGKTSEVPPVPLLETILAVEALKLPADGWLEHIQTPGAKWRLVFTGGSKDIAAASKKQPHKGGQYFPIPACQMFTKKDGIFKNGVFLGGLFYLTFSGPFKMTGRRLEFDVVDMVVGIGPWALPFTLKKSSPLTDEGADKAARGKLPFFLYAYADQDIIVARGRGGGVALWQRTSSEWEAKTGVIQVYK